jgi:enoyl-CoA hydratase
VGSLVSYQVQDSVATIAMDDGKVNVLSVAMFAEVNSALDRAEADRAVVVLSGRQGVFSAGFDLRVLNAGGSEARTMVREGFQLGARLLAFPTPVVVACSGHALAMGSFLLLSVDYRVGAAGAYRIGANEVSLGITMPHFGIEISRQRLAPAHFHRAVITAEIYTPDEAVAAGFLDRVVPAEDLKSAALSTATRLAALNMEAHAATKLRARAQALTAVRAGIEADDDANRTLV